MEPISTVNSSKELVKEANKLSKREVKVIEDKDIKHVLVGTPLAYEDELCDSIEKTFKQLAEVLHLNFDSNDYVDDVSDIRDRIMDCLLKGNKADIVYGSIEY